MQVLEDADGPLDWFREVGSSVMAQKLMESHKRFILNQVAAFILSPTEISRKLQDEEEGVRYGFSPVLVSPQAVGKKIGTLKDGDIADARARFLVDFEDTPLAFRKKRVEALAVMVKRIENDPKLSVKNKYVLTLQVYRDIKGEIGEDIDKLAEAIGRSGGTHVVNLYAGLKDTEREQKFRNLGAIANRLGDRFRPCSN